jgi:1,4-dihydroxy-6-naphthoate synthase
MVLQTYISPCPNDTFAFNALVNNLLPNHNLQFKTFLHDIEELNAIALLGKAHIVKASFALWPQLKKNYNLLSSGAALGTNVGPLFISHKTVDTTLNNLKIAIPGLHTTANFLLQFAYPHLTNKTPILFSQIEPNLLNGNFDAGVIIHENRFTYQNHGLQKIADLGETWYKKTKLPIPLGGIFIHKNLPASLQKKVAQQLKLSIQLAWQQYPSLPNFVTQNAQEMSQEVMLQHINLYVNKYTLNLGSKGLKAIALMESIIETKKS